MPPKGEKVDTARKIVHRNSTMYMPSGFKGGRPRIKPGMNHSVGNMACIREVESNNPEKSYSRKWAIGFFDWGLTEQRLTSARLVLEEEI